MPDLFLSYSSTDAVFAAALARELSRHDLEACVERSSEDHGVSKCPPQVARAITESDVLVFLVRPESLRCSNRQAELELAFSSNKRVIAVLREDPGDAPVPDRLAAIKWIPAHAEEQVGKVVKSLVHTLRGEIRSARPHRPTSMRGRRRRWRQTLKPRWKESKEAILAAAAVTALILGTIGFLQAPGQHYTFLDSVYRALGLFLFGGAVSFKVPVTLQIARILAPLALGFAAFRGIVELFADEFQTLRIRVGFRDHVVVAGLGASGAHLVRSFYGEGWVVVAIENDPANRQIGVVRDLGVPVVRGDARDAGTLRRAMVKRASHMVVTCGDDGVNFDVAMAASDQVADRARGVLSAFVHIRDLRLWRGLKARATTAIDASAFRLEVFNVYFTAAHLMVDKLSPFEDGEGNELDDPHVCVVGVEGVGEGLIRRTAATWRERHPERKLRLTIAGPSADVELQSLVSRSPALEDICELDARPMDISSAEFARGGVLLDPNGECDVTKAYVALGSQGESLAAAFGLHGDPATAGVPVVVAVDDGTSGIARALGGLAEGVVFSRAMKPFGVLSSALTPAITLQGMTELIARQRHAEWLRASLAEGRQSDATVPWEQLGEEYREANRQFADGIGAALSEAGCALAPAPLSDATAAKFAFSDDELETLARREHERWMEDKIRDGWRLGSQKSVVKRTHPDLVAWDRLRLDARNSNREAIRDLPRLLAAVGLEIYRPRSGSHHEQHSLPLSSALSASAE